ncbi:NUDIX domain-containing protein [Candidatus Gottesmanbacteria bacterium]|nr:NUDIX domain-containing protein [Candidatus Gottesmanbacteria bacterium]
MIHHLTALITEANGTPDIKTKFINRLQEGSLARSENPTSHLCVYFAAFDPADGSVFIGHHKKSGLWLFNGGHMDPGETPLNTVIREASEEWGLVVHPGAIAQQKLITLTRIEHPEQIICEWHYDVWHFLPFDRKLFHPKDRNLRTEFYSYGWKSFDEAANLLTSQPTVEALTYLRNLR